MISLEKWFEIETNIISQVKTLDFSNKEITEIPSLVKYKNLTRLNCNNNYLTEIPELPDNLRFLDVRNNYIESLPSRLPHNLVSFNCANNRIRQLPPQLPPYLKILICNNNQLETIPHLNRSRLVRIECMKNNIHYLNNIPSNVIVLNYDPLPLREDPFLMGELQKKIWINGQVFYTDAYKVTPDFVNDFSDSDRSRFFDSDMEMCNYSDSERSEFSF